MATLSVKIGGEAGFGIMTTGLLFSKVAARSGYHIVDYIEYPSLIRGGHNAYEITFSDQPITALKKQVDFLVCLNEDTFNKQRHLLHSESAVIFDGDEFNFEAPFIKVKVPFKKIIDELKGKVVMKNTIALGALLALVGGNLVILDDLIREQFLKKGEKVIFFNQSFAHAGFNFVKENYSHLIKDYLKERESKEAQLVLSGNDSFSLAAVAADCRLYASYPMTPSSSVLSTLASWQSETKMIVRHAEDEISVINTALGASFAGVRSAVGTSGGGFSLMVESISFAGVAEIPIVIFLASRPGPATGMPTWTEQGDLLFACFAGHGEFPKIVLAPGDQEEMLELTLKAFDLTDYYQTPVIVLSDMYLSEGHRSLRKKKVEEILFQYHVNRGKLNLNGTTSLPSSLPRNFLRYQVTDDGISERLIPGTSGFFYQANSYEHLEDGHTTEEAKPRKDQVDKRNRKWITYLARDFFLPKFYGSQEAEIVFVSWGANKGTILEAQRLLRDKGLTTGFYHFTHLYPLDREKVRQLFSSNKRYILVENNSWAQFGKLLAMETGVIVEEKILRYDGRPIEVGDIFGFFS
ncbi:MAG: 2-oxoacid:acceptor oxidoreductase subunit alpha [Patescibacteria group bacterium]|nr:2-oxoacid:acceptor oxidoreductase subunit alpha [Patescibacteria group bacterium]